MSIRLRGLFTIDILRFITKMYCSNKQHVTGDIGYKGTVTALLVQTNSVLGTDRMLHVLIAYASTERGGGFEDEDLGSSPGWWAATVATYCPSRPGELPKFLSTKPHP